MSRLCYDHLYYNVDLLRNNVCKKGYIKQIFRSLGSSVCLWVLGS